MFSPGPFCKNHAFPKSEMRGFIVIRIVISEILAYDSTGREKGVSCNGTGGLFKIKIPPFAAVQTVQLLRCQEELFHHTVLRIKLHKFSVYKCVEAA